MENINHQADLLGVVNLACRVRHRRLLGKCRSNDSFQETRHRYRNVHVQMEHFISDLTGLRFRSSANIAVVQ